MNENKRCSVVATIARGVGRGEERDRQRERERERERKRIGTSLYAFSPKISQILHEAPTPRSIRVACARSGHSGTEVDGYIVFCPIYFSCVPARLIRRDLKRSAAHTVDFDQARLRSHAHSAFIHLWATQHICA